MATKIEQIPYGGWPNCYRITNEEVELIVTSDVGPRVIRCGFVGGQNFFAELPNELGKSGEAWWMARGGHRLWVAPETIPDTYALDNGPVKTIVNGNRITLLQPIEPETALQKEIFIELSPGGLVTVTHRIENTGPKSRRLAPWALSQMTPGGVAVALFPPRATHEQQLLPSNPLVMWAYTDFSDARWKFTSKYLILKSDSARSNPQKAGLFNANTVGAYLLGSDLFIKHTEANPHAAYPDFQCSFEMFTNEQFLELETLGAIVDLIPGNSVAHVERWSLHRNVNLESFTDDEIDRLLLPQIKWSPAKP